MLDHVLVFSPGGAVLWERVLGTARRPAVAELIQRVLLEDRAAAGEHVTAPAGPKRAELRLRWSMAPGAGFVVVLVCPKFVQPAPTAADALLQQLRDAFARDCKAALAEAFPPPGSAAAEAAAAAVGAFDAKFDGLYAAFERLDKEARSAAAADAAGVGDKAGGKSAAKAAALPVGKGKSKGESKRKGEGGAQAAADAPSDADQRKMIERFRAQMIARNTDGSVRKVEETNWGALAPRREALASWLKKFHVGNRRLEKAELDALMPPLRERLIAKNVAVEVADSVCESVRAGVAGAEVGRLEQFSAALEGAMTAALRRILRPKRDVNVLRMVEGARGRGRPFSIVFCGVNGVGKSTSLAKVAYYLQQHGVSMLMAAGDTFRHGAVEQIGVHARCLDVPVVSLGYGADPSAVAAAAIQAATKSSRDAVLIDTAGRMQDHESRMRALAKMIHDNTPDLVLFVGEALVGNNGIDQLRKFNACLHDFTPVGARPRGIDGIVMTKFDTIDDKVGTAVSMVYELGQPIVFVGVGQSYQDLKVLEPDLVVQALMQ